MKQNKNLVMANRIKKIRVYDSNMLENVIREFKSMAEFEEWMENEKPSNVSIYADQVEIVSTSYPDGFVLLGWDELDLFYF